MHKEFEGRTEQEAIDKAVEELGLDRDDFDVEILEKEKKGLFRKGNVRIRVYFGEDDTGTLIVTQSHNIVVGAFNRFGIIQGIGVEADRSAQNLRTDILFGVVDDVESPVTYRVEPSSIERIIGCSSRIVVGKYVDSEEPIDAVVVKHSLPIGIITGQKTFYLYGKIYPLVSNR